MRVRPNVAVTVLVVVFVFEQEEVEGAEGGEAHGVRLHAAHLRRAPSRSAAVRRRLPQPNAHDRVVSVSFSELCSL